MATHANIVDVEDEDMSKLSSAEFYASAKHQAVRKSLGFGTEPRELPPRTWVPNDNWRKLRGILSEFGDQDTTEMKEAERAREREHDERKFGPISKR